MRQTRGNNKNDQWRNTDALLRRWLAERQHLLSLYCSLSSPVKSAAAAELLQQRLDRFCEILVDYVSAGHFEVFCSLFEEGERSGVSRTDAIAALYRMIVPTTAIALDFNDRHLKEKSGVSLARDLSRLGHVLASRFDWEDALIRKLHFGHRAVA